MKYESTRGNIKNVSFCDAVRTGICPDGGLFIPMEDVKIDSLDLSEICAMNYTNLACEIINCYTDDLTEEQVRECVENAYNSGKFPLDNPAPVKILSSNLSVLELWHGPTCAFKDMALQLLPQFLSKAIEKNDNNKEMIILTATSGDTGKAALDGFKDVPGIRVIVFYPEEGVSEVQKAQMVTQEGDNVTVIAVKGNFDDAQTGVKKIFADREYAQILSINGYCLSSANSINWGRLLPQIVYYFHAYTALINSGEIKIGERVNFVVPTGNFGDILAGFYAMKMGLPINRLICAANSNNVVSEFMRTGTYDKNRKFVTTNSPAMDILISSNLERLLFEMSGKDSEKISDWMKSLSELGTYTIDKKTHVNINHLFWSSWSSDQETLAIIKNIYDDYDYLIDTHTAVGISVYDKYVISTGDMTKTIAISTASPFKFNTSVAQSILNKEDIEWKTEFEILDILSQKTGQEIPIPLRGLKEKEVLHKTVCEIDEMKAQVSKYLF